MATAALSRHAPSTTGFFFYLFVLAPKIQRSGAKNETNVPSNSSGEQRHNEKFPGTAGPIITAAHMAARLGLIFGIRGFSQFGLEISSSWCCTVASVLYWKIDLMLSWHQSCYFEKKLVKWSWNLQLYKDSVVVQNYLWLDHQNRPLFKLM